MQPSRHETSLDLRLGMDIPVRLYLPNAVLSGDLHVPNDAKGLVIFAHGSGSGRFSPRNRAVAHALNEHLLGTFLVDLLTDEEERADAETGYYRFDIPRLAGRLEHISQWAAEQDHLKSFPLGLFGASTGAGAALMAAARRPSLIKAVVSRGGRPDLAGPCLAKVKAPTLLIVGELDTPVIELNEKSRLEMSGPTELQIVPGASHLFEERGALAEVSRLATDWFRLHLG
jgi:pimeloyl-ACP methyl ester carboxylesterase